MQILRFSANFADFVAKKVIFVNRLNPLRQFRGYGRGLGVFNAYSGCAQCIICYYFHYCDLMLLQSECVAYFFLSVAFSISMREMVCLTH